MWLLSETDSCADRYILGSVYYLAIKNFYWRLHWWRRVSFSNFKRKPTITFKSLRYLPEVRLMREWLFCWGWRNPRLNKLMGPEFPFVAYVSVLIIFSLIYFIFLYHSVLFPVCWSVSYLNKFAQGLLAYLRLCNQLESYLRVAVWMCTDVLVVVVFFLIEALI